MRLGNERERHDDLGAHLTDELLDLRRPVRLLRGLAADARTIGEILVSPDVDDLVEWPDLGVQERRELRILLPVLVSVAEALLDLSQAAGRDLVGVDLVNSVPLLSPMSGRGRVQVA